MYQKLDALILSNIGRRGEASLSQAIGHAALAEAERIARLTGRLTFRVADGRLQALRKRGLILHSGGKWRLAAPSPSAAM